MIVDFTIIFTLAIVVIALWLLLTIVNFAMVIILSLIVIGWMSMFELKTSKFRRFRWGFTMLNILIFQALIWFNYDMLYSVLGIIPIMIVHSIITVKTCKGVLNV